MTILGIAFFGIPWYFIVMVKELWIKRRLLYLSGEGRKMSRFFLYATLLSLVLCAFAFSHCLVLLSAVFGLSAIMARVIAFIAAMVLAAIVTVFWPNISQTLPIRFLLPHQDRFTSSNLVPPPGIPLTVLHH